MVYDILIVDDEPIILAGIKFILNWEEHGAKVVATAQNGKKALEYIEENAPDIVICDINMPIMTGIELLEACQGLSHIPEFIMLTNHEDFDFVKKSMNNNAIDYLLKAQLDPELLIEALNKAKNIIHNKNLISTIGIEEKFIKQKKHSEIVYALTSLLFQNIEKSNDNHIIALRKNDITSNFSVVNLFLDYAQVDGIEAFLDNDIQMLFESIKEIVVANFSRIHKSYVVLGQDQIYNKITLALWDIEQLNYLFQVKNVYDLIMARCFSTYNVRVSIGATKVIENVNNISKIFYENENLINYHYNTGKDVFKHVEYDQFVLAPLKTNAILNKLGYAFFSKDMSKIGIFFEKVHVLMNESNHRRIDGIQLLSMIYSQVENVFTSMTANPDIDDTSANYILREIQWCNTKKNALDILAKLERYVGIKVDNINSGKRLLKDEITDYIKANITKRIMLSDIALHVGMAPSYLSSIYKEKYNINLVDYINEIKMKKASEMLKSMGENSKIYEVSYYLAFENAYYFSKLFKRHFGLTPKEYQLQFKNEIHNK